MWSGVTRATPPPKGDAPRGREAWQPTGVGQSACQGECLAKWPAYLADGAAPAGLDAKDLGTITRADGKRQTTYKGRPLYLFSADKGPGDTKGQGMKDVWYVATP